jgi:hypothetical protein
VDRWIAADPKTVVALTSQTAVGKESGAPVELKLGQVWEFEDQRLTRVTAYLTHAEALKAAGVPE